VAALSQSDKLKATIRSKGQASRNANDAISIVQVASGALKEMSSMVLRMRELAVQSASDVYTTGDRHRIGMEFRGLSKEIDRIAKVTEYNGTKLFLGKEKKLDIHIDSGSDMKKNKVSLDLSELAQTVWALGISDAKVDSQLHAQTSIPKLDYALRSLSESDAKLGAIHKRFESAVSKISSEKQSLGSAKSKLTDADYAEESAKYVAAKTQKDAQQMVIKYANFDQNVMLKLFEKS
jgi:flagellin